MPLDRVDVTVALALHGNWWGEVDLENALSSLLRQEFRNWRLMVVDATGRLWTRPMLKRMIPAAQLLAEPLYVGGLRGEQDCLWQALAETRSRWVSYIDPGAVWDPTHLMRLVMMAKSYELDAVFSGQREEGFWGRIGSELRQQNIVDPAAILHTDNIYRKTNGWQRRQPYLADWDLWLQMVDRSARFGHVPVQTVERRRSKPGNVGEKGADVIRAMHGVRDLVDEFTEEELLELRAADAEINAQKA